MMDGAAETTRQCWRCGGDVAAAIVCTRCAAVQPLPAGLDHFAALGIPRRLVVDVADLEHQYHALSRAVHPDRHQTADMRERELSLAASAAVNRAYRTLRDPVARGRYWLELHGEPLGEGNAHVPAAIAAEVFETQEQLEELRAASGPAAARLRGEVEASRAHLRTRLDGLRDALVTRYGAGNGASITPEELRQRLSEIAYLRTLFGDIDEALGEERRGTDHRH